MPQTVKSNKWFVRIDGNKEFLQGKVNELLGMIDTVKLLVLFHVGSNKENPHIHFVYESSTIVQQQSLNVRFKKFFCLDKKTQYCSKLWLTDGCCSYMFHEENALIMACKGFTEIDINKFIDDNKKVQDVVAINKSRSPTRIVDKILTNVDTTSSRKDIFTLLVQAIRDGTMYEPGDFVLKRYVEEIYLKSRANNEIDAYIDERFGNLFSKY